MNTNRVLNKAMRAEFLSATEGLFLLSEAPLAELMWTANEIRKILHPDGKVTWIIDRNVNITNVCMSGCKFCNFHCTPKSKNAYITIIEQYIKKIDETIQLGGEQLLLQGGMHPDLGLSFYTDLFSQLKKLYPKLKLHALGPPEIAFLAKKEQFSYKKVLEILMEAGLDSLPGAGAEILSDRVRHFLSPGKCSAKEWLDVMRIAHKLNLVTSATMMFGHVETIAERMEHLVKLREVQLEKPENAPGFLSFIPWPFQHKNTVLFSKYNVSNRVNAEEYLRMIAVSRLMLPNIPNLQPSWLTVGKQTAQLCLHAGANDFGSIMIEENVVSGAGASNNFNAAGIQNAIREAGFTPQQRNQRFEYIYT
ncbi:MAG: dehypoxanthine futalosine cyclase [Lentimicrobiaceae bacterium]|nr:dehypoxanthine futalosine cyclase [Lentimicrobiaceae bacterium]